MKHELFVTGQEITVFRKGVPICNGFYCQHLEKRFPNVVPHEEKWMMHVIREQYLSTSNLKLYLYMALLSRV